MHLLNQSALLKMLGWALFNSFWQMSLMWLLYIVITSSGIKKISANAKSNLALLLLGSGSLWFFTTIAINCFHHDYSNGAIIASNIFLNNPMSFLYSWKQGISNLLPYCSLAYLSALGFLLFRYLKFYGHSQHLKQVALHKAPVELRIFVENLVARIGIHKMVRLWLSSAIQSPMTIGFLKPVILIPLATINHLSPQQMEAVLLHELAHIKRNDYLLNLMVAFAEIIFFFNPFSLLLIHTIKKERENSCDDLVMQFRYDPCAYASALLSLEKARYDQKLAMAAVGKNNKMLLQRVIRITGQKKVFQDSSRKFILMALIAVTAAFTALVQPQLIVAKTTAHSRLAEVKKINSPELQQLSYIITKSSSNKKEEGAPGKPKAGRHENSIYSKKSSAENDFELVSNHVQDDIEENGNVNQAIAAEPREYSITLSATPAPPAKIALQNYPYVPGASFSYKEIEDTSVPKEMLSQLDAEKDAKLAMEKSLKAINKIDWIKIGKEINISRKDLDIEKLQNEIRKSLRDLDWDKINKEVTDDADETDEKRMRQDLQVQLQALQNIRYKDLQKANQLQQQIIQQQLKLQQAAIKKQQELMRQVEEIRKKIKIVYI